MWMKKIKSSVFWDHKAILLIKFLPQVENINSSSYYDTLKKSRSAIHNKWRGLLMKRVGFLHNNARPPWPTQVTLWIISMGCFEWIHTHLWPGIFRLSFSLQLHMVIIIRHIPKDANGRENISTDEEVKVMMKNWTKEWRRQTSMTSHKKLNPRLTKSVKRNGDYEKIFHILCTEVTM